MSLELIRATPEHAPVLARIFFDAFQQISVRHGFPMDVPDVGVAGMLMQSLTSRPDCYGVAAVEDGTIVGCNFTQLSDAVSGVGPICISPHAQSKGIGRRLMAHVIEYSLARHGPMVRLLQDAFNMTSISLYTALGFTTQEPMVLLQVVPAEKSDPAIRPLTAADLSACNVLCETCYKVSRKNELAMMIRDGAASGTVPHGKFVNGRPSAFVIPGFLGFGVGGTDADVLDAAQEASRVSPPHNHRLFVPARRGGMLRDALSRGFKSLKIMNLMSIGPYEAPVGAWCSSVAY